MDLHLKNKVILISGGSTGLGKSISTLGAEEGAFIAINYIVDPEGAKRLAEELSQRFQTKCQAFYGDISKEDDVKNMFAEIESSLGPVDALVNCAAYCANPPCAELELPEFQKCLAVNLQGVFLMSRELIRRLIARGVRGNIVNISSQAALRGSQNGKTAYDMTKAGVCGFTRSLAIEVGKYGINVNAVLPGLMYTDILAKQIDTDPEKYNKRSVLNRIARCEEIGQVVLFLCSDRASYMTGASVDVSGGMAMH